MAGPGAVDDPKTRQRSFSGSRLRRTPDRHCAFESIEAEVGAGARIRMTCKVEPRELVRYWQGVLSAGPTRRILQRKSLECEVTVIASCVIESSVPPGFSTSADLLDHRRPVRAGNGLPGPQRAPKR